MKYIFATLFLHLSINYSENQHLTSIFLATKKRSLEYKSLKFKQIMTNRPLVGETTGLCGVCKNSNHLSFEMKRSVAGLLMVKPCRS